MQNEHRHGRRLFLQQMALLGLSGPTFALSVQASSQFPQASNTIAAAWRGPAESDPYYAGLLRADWTRERLEILSETRLPTRPHGLLAETEGHVVVVGVRPGNWMMRLDSNGNPMARVDLSAEPGQCRLNGHVIVGANPDTLLTTETDHSTGAGKIGVRDRRTLHKIASWDSHGLEPHQLVLDTAGRVMIANGGIRRDMKDQKLDLNRMDSSLVRLDGITGRLLQQWQAPDPRLSLRHLAWSTTKLGKHYLGIAIQAEHDSKPERAKAPILAVLADDELIIPQTGGDPQGYAGDIAPAFAGGFALSSNGSNVTRVWHPGLPDKLTAIVELPETYALSAAGETSPGSVLVASAPGIIRWHPNEPARFLAWPKPMALDNHWVVMS